MVSVDNAAALLPVRTKISGQETARKLQRTLYVYIVIVVVGLALVVASPSPAAKAFGLGLICPGGGLWYMADPLMAVASAIVVVFIGGMIWILSGAMFVWPLLWLVTAGLGAHHAYSVAHHVRMWQLAQWIVPAAAAVFLVGSLVARRAAWWTSRRRFDSINTHLIERNQTRLNAVQAEDLRPDELTDQDLAFARYLLNLALQPYDSFAGFDMLEQFQGSSLRYQLTAMQGALASYQSAHTPAFSGYLAAAQHATVSKMTHPKVWGYWFWENLIGNFRVGRDPIVRDNVMFSGYLATMLGAYVASTGDKAFDADGSLTFTHKKHMFSYDHLRVALAVRDNMFRSDLCLYPCEPNFVYPVCNAIGLAGLFAYDQTHGTDISSEVTQRFRKAWDEEFLAFSGRPLFLRSSRLGLTLPTLRMAANDAAIAAALRPVLPDIAYRTWEVMRMQAIDLTSTRVVRMAPWERIDPGTYRPSTMTTYATLAAAAVAMGDTEVSNAMFHHIDGTHEVCEHDGAMRFPNLSVLTNMAYIIARFHRAAMPVAAGMGPRLAQVAFPDVFVVKAIAHDGVLRAVLQPGNTPQPLTRLKFDRLDPGRRYRLNSDGTESDVHANQHGEAVVDIQLVGRTRVELLPSI